MKEVHVQKPSLILRVPRVAVPAAVLATALAAAVRGPGHGSCRPGRNRPGSASLMGERQCDPDEEVHAMRRLLVIGVIAAVVAAVGVAIAIAATGGGGSSSTASGATVSVKKVAGAGSVLVDSKGRALYRSEQERNGMVLCTGACLSFWQPLTVKGSPAAHSLSGRLATVKRPDGGRQVTYNGKLLYSFKLDKPGKVSGDGFKDAFGGRTFRWHVVRPVGASSSGSTTPSPMPTYPSY
jgi:predicted lipoprotein with Yx(FWY)xxD motif